jgi:hypothetical protein
MNQKEYSPEMPVIRPPSEWRSIFIRSTRGCHWNRCKFCGIYTVLGEPVYSIRSIEEVKRDIDWYAENIQHRDTAFLADADPLSRPTGESIEILSYLRLKIPEIQRVTAYARFSTLFKLGADSLRQFREAGLDRIHAGMESGNSDVLKFHCKGQSPKIIIQSSDLIKKAGIELSCYVLLGLGGTKYWKEHIEDTARVINRINPEFIRIRRLWIYTREETGGMVESPLVSEIKQAAFIPQDEEGTVLEMRLLVENLEGITSTIVSDHANNYLKVNGTFPDDKPEMLSEIERFLLLPVEIRRKVYAQTGSQI